jgi:MFS family permease
MSSAVSVKSIDRPKEDLQESAPKVENEYADAEKNFQPKTLKFWTILAGVYLAIFLIALVSWPSLVHEPAGPGWARLRLRLTLQQDRTIIATAIPTITDEFDSIADIGWYGSAYMLTAASFNPIFGRLYQLYATKTLFLVSLVIFEAGSALCGAAPSSIAFIIGRAIAGLGSAGVFIGSTMTIMPLIPLAKRPIFTSMFGLAFGISSVLGPIVGGTFTDKV